MDQILVSVCCATLNEHKYIENIANSHVGVILKGRRKCPKIHVLLLFHLLRHTFFVQAVSQELLQIQA